jgi:hypothetical protein
MPMRVMAKRERSWRGTYSRGHAETVAETMGEPRRAGSARVRPSFACGRNDASWAHADGAGSAGSNDALPPVPKERYGPGEAGRSAAYRRSSTYSSARRSTKSMGGGGSGGDDRRWWWCRKQLAMPRGSGIGEAGPGHTFYVGRGSGHTASRDALTGSFGRRLGRRAPVPSTRCGFWLYSGST